MKYSNRHISDEELDQLFRDAHASEGQESLFVPEFWSEMEAMLPAAEKSKRGFYWIPLAATAVLFGVILFYPSSPVQIDRLEQNPHSLSDSHSVSGSHSAPVIAENATTQTTFISEKTTNNPKIRTKFITPNREIGNQSDLKQNQRIVDNSQTVPVEEFKTPEEPTRIHTVPQEQLTGSLVPELNMESENELDFDRLEPRHDQIVHDRIADLPKKVSNETNQWYVELGPTIGQSPYMSPNQKRNVVGGAVLGGGYTKRIDNAFVSFGLQARMEGFGGLDYRETNFTPNITRTVSVKQLYSLEVPLRFGYSFKKSEISFCVTPGVQLFVHGKEQIMQNQVVQREDSYTGKVEHSNSLTMEFGFQYYYNLSSKYSIGAKVNADILRPFHTDYYLGKLSSFPVNGQIVIRRTFSK